MPSCFKASWPVIVAVAIGGVLIGGAFWATHKPENSPPSRGKNQLSTQEPPKTGSTIQPPNTRTTRKLSTPETPPLEPTQNPQSYYDALTEQSAETLWRKWRQSLESSDNTSEDSELVWVALIYQLRRDNNTNQHVYAAAADLLTRSSLPLALRTQVVALLSSTMTPDALSIMIDTAMNNNQDPLRPAILEGISQTGDDLWADQIRLELSQPLEAAWNGAANNDHDLLNALAVALAKVGAPEGVRSLLLTLANSDQTIDEVYRAGNSKALTALTATDKISNPEVVPLLKEGLQRQSLADPVFIGSGNALANIPSFEASDALITWAQTAPDAAILLATRWIRKVIDTQAIQHLKETLASSAPFRSNAVKEALNEALKNKPVVFDQ